MTAGPSIGFHPRFELIDLLRGWAALMVVGFHSVLYVLPASGADTQWGTVSVPLWVMSRGAFGVTLFFVISGYCIFATTHSTLRKRKGVVEFLKRRAKRIYPPFWASIVLVLLIAVTLDVTGQQSLMGWESITDPRELSPFEWMTNLTLTHTWLPSLAGTGSRTVNGVSWSLCYEEQFYLVCAAGLLFAPRRFFRAATLISVAVLLICVWSFARQGTVLELVRGTFLGPKWLQFGVGGLVYYRLVVAGRAAARAADVVLWLGPTITAVVMVAFEPAHGLQWSNQVFQLWVATSFALGLRLVRGREPALIDALRKMRVLSPLRELGRMTYSVYLVHAPIIMVVTLWFAANGWTSAGEVLFIAMPICVALSLVGSKIFFELVERHFLNAPSVASAPAPVQPA